MEPFHRRHQGAIARPLAPRLIVCRFEICYRPPRDFQHFWHR